jgi:GTP cyclohydrolase I
MIDVQNQLDCRNIPIWKVGVKGIKYPIRVLDRSAGTQAVNATINMFVNLPHHFKGTHMSRFVEILNDYRGHINIKTFPEILEQLKAKLEAQAAHIDLKFAYFVEKQAPVSGARSLMEYQCFFEGISQDGRTTLTVGVVVPVTTVCPCSKEISIHGAHNQRGLVTVKFRFQRFFWIEDIISLIEESASGGVYSLLKRVDEKYVTEAGYENPMFVEDVVRNVAVRLNQDDNFLWYSVEADNFESIHNHNAYAYLEKEPSCS